MLSPADRAVVERDRALAGLALLLDAPALASALGLGQLDPAYLRYKPGTSCVAGFLHSERGALAAHAYPRERYAEVRERKEWRDAADVLMLDDACIAVVPARLDRALGTLRRFGDEARRPGFLRRLIGRRGGICDGDYTILRYKPGRRLVARLDVAGRPRAALKVTAAADFDAALIGATGAAALGGAPLLGADAHRHALVTGWVTGEPLCPVAAGRPPGISAIAQTGAALANLHAAAFRPAARTTRSGEVAALEEVAPALAALDQPLSLRAGQLAREIARRLTESEGSETLIHGDFSADQVVHSGDRPVILDWDHAATGDPARDFGTFLARLDAQRVDGVLAPDDGAAIGDAFTDGYGSAAGRLPEGIALQHARALLMLATEGFRIRHPQWPARTATLLERAEELLSAPRRRAGDPDMPALEAALTPDVVRPALAAALGNEPGEIRINAPKLLRHKRGRRALVRYDIVGPDGSLRTLLGKLRAKGPDRRAPALHDKLRSAGLDGHDPLRIGVPRAAGSIDALGLWLQEMVPGQPLADLLAPKAERAPFARTGVALAELHRRGPEGSRRWTLDDEFAVLERALSEAAAKLPDAATALQAICGGACARLAALGEGIGCGIHRDFYFDQVIVDRDRIWIVDLDLFAHGDPAIDLGNFLAHLDEFGLRKYGDPAALAAQASAFIDGYAATGVLPDDARLSTQRSVSLARHINLSLRFRERSHTTRDLVELAAAALTEPETGTP